MAKMREATSDPLRTLRYDAGSPVLDLVATVGRRGSGKGIERLTETTLMAWLAQMSLQADASDLQDLRVLREAVARLLDVAMSRRPPRPEDIATVNGFAVRPSQPRRLRVSNLGVFEVDGTHPDALGLLADCQVVVNTHAM